MAVDFRKGSQGTDAASTNVHDVRGTRSEGTTQTAAEARDGTARGITDAMQKGMVARDGVEPDISVEDAQLTDSVNARIGMISNNAKSTVRSLYSLFPELLELQSSTFRRPYFCERAF